jgi:hypothetical protein
MEKMKLYAETWEAASLDSVKGSVSLQTSERWGCIKEDIQKR